MSITQHHATDREPCFQNMSSQESCEYRPQRGLSANITRTRRRTCTKQTVPVVVVLVLDDTDTKLNLGPRMQLSSQPYRKLPIR